MTCHRRAAAFPRNAATRRFSIEFEAAVSATVLARIAVATPVWLEQAGAGTLRTAVEHVMRTLVVPSLGISGDS